MGNRKRGHFHPAHSLAALLGAIAVLFAAHASASAASFDCVMDPSLVVKLGSPVTSVLSGVMVNRGDLVKKGQPIAQIESSVEKAAVATYQARAASTAEIDAKQALLKQKSDVFKRKLDLQKHNFSSTQDVDNAKADFDVAKQELALAQLNHKMAQLELKHARALLEQRTIRSPIDGVVMQRTLGPGEYVRPEASIITIARIDPLSVETYLPVHYYGMVKVGDIATVKPAAPIGGNYKAKVSVVDQVFDAASGTFGVRLNLPNPQHHLPGGVRCRVTFNVPEQVAHDPGTPEDKP
jgi:RND family efflux transporter MFP subunit